MSWRPDEVVAVVNPRAAGGRVAKKWPSLQRQLIKRLGPIGFRLTEHERHAVLLAKEAIEDGAKVVLGLGGDGTLGAVAEGIFAAGGGTMGVLPAGTGGDFRRCLAHGKSLFSSAAALPTSRAYPIDLGRIRYQAGARSEERIFLNLASLGMSGTVDRLVNESSKRLGRFAFLYGVLATLFRYKPARVRIEVDGQHQGDHEVFAVLVANGRFAGGGMCFAPEARLDDGLMDIIIVPTRPSLAALRLLPSVYSGTYLKDPDLIHLRGRQIHTQCLSGPTPDVDVDGEAPGTLEAQFDTVVGAIRMLDVAAELLQHAS